MRIVTSVNATEAMSDSMALLKKQLLHKPNDKELLRQLGFLCLNVSDFDNAITYGNRLLKLAYNEQDYHGYVLYAHICLGQAYMMKGNSYEAMRNLGQAQRNAETAKNDTALCSVYNGLGLYATDINKDYYQAQEYFFKGLEAAKRCRYEKLYSILLTNIARVYYLKSDTTGMKYAQECYELGQRRGDPFLRYLGAVNTAYMYHLKKNPLQALRLLREAEEQMRASGMHDEANIYNLYGRVYHSQGRDDEAERCFLRAIHTNDTGNVASVIHAYLGYADMMTQQGNHARANSLLHTALRLSGRHSSNVYRGELLHVLSQSYESAGQTAEALRYYKLYLRETDSMYNAARERAVNEIRAKFDIERQENIIRQNQVELQNRQGKMYLSLLLMVCAFVIAGLIVYLYYRKNKLYKAIVRQYQEAFRQEHLLREELANSRETIRRLAPQEDDHEGATAADAHMGTTGKYAYSSLTDEKKDDLFERMETMLSEQRVYTDNLLTKAKMAELLGTNRTYLSQIINERTHQSFTQLVTSYRMREAIRILSDPADDTPLKMLAANVGVNSMTTFYRQFQQATGMTPKEFRRKVKELQTAQ